MRYRRNTDENFRKAQRDFLSKGSIEEYLRYLAECRRIGIEPEIPPCTATGDCHNPTFRECETCATRYCLPCAKDFLCKGHLQTEKDAKGTPRIVKGKKECNQLLCCEIPECGACARKQCTREGCSENYTAQTCAGDNEHLVCEDKECERKCENCDEDICNTCAEECSRCEKIYCNNCSETCAACTGRVSNDACPSEECKCYEGCGVCDDCQTNGRLRKCDTCDNKACPEHIQMCGFCNEYHCDACEGKKCEECETNYCGKCAEGQQTVGERFIAPKVAYCIECERDICVTCVIDECQKCGESICGSCQEKHTDKEDAEHPELAKDKDTLKVGSRVRRPDGILGSVVKIAKQEDRVRIIVEWDDDTATKLDRKDITQARRRRYY